MRRLPYLGRIAAVMLMAAGLPACSSIFDGLQDMEGIETGEAPAASLPQRVGDRLFGEAASAEVRAVRQEMAVGAYMYLLSDRVARFDPAIADQALGRMQALRGVLASRSVTAGDTFPETMMGEVTIELVGIAIDSGLERAANFAGLFAGGPNITGLLLRGRVAARQSFFVNLLVTDVRNAVARMNGDPEAIAGARADAAALMCASENRVRAIAGAPALDCAGGGPA